MYYSFKVLARGTLPTYCYPLLASVILVGIGLFLAGYDRQGNVIGILLLLVIVGLLASLFLLLAKGIRRKKP